MRLMKPADVVIFADDNIEGSFNLLQEGNWWKKAIRRSIKDIKFNAFCGERIQMRLILKEYVRKHRNNNLLWYQLPDVWRLVYLVMTSSNKEILAVIVEYFDHKKYERRFGY